MASAGGEVAMTFGRVPRKTRFLARLASSQDLANPTLIGIGNVHVAQRIERESFWMVELCSHGGPVVSLVTSTPISSDAREVMQNLIRDLPTFVTVLSQA